MTRPRVLCRLVDEATEAEELAWQQLDSRSSSKPVADLRVTGRSTNAAEENSISIPHTLADAESSKQRSAELEAQHNRELEKARQSGVEQGFRQARQEASAEMEGALDRLACSIQEITQVKRKARNEAEGELVMLTLAIARRILHREVMTDPDSLHGLVHAALQKLQNREILKIRVFPAGVPTVRAAVERRGGLSNIEIMGDPALETGGVIVETSLGELDASVETQLKEIERGFADRLGHW